MWALSIASLTSGNAGVRVVCVDAWEKMLERLVEKHGDLLGEQRVLVVLGNLVRLPFKAGIFNYAHSEAIPLRTPGMAICRHGRW